MEKESFKPYDKVLVRDRNNEVWMPAFFRDYDESIPEYRFVTMDNVYAQCVPYEGNEHLIGTNGGPVKEPKQKERWRAKRGEEYYYLCVDNNVFVEQDWEEDYNDNFHSNPLADEHYQLGNYFRTKEEAEAMRIKIKELLKGE